MKLNFLARLYYAITDFRLYPYVVQKETLKNSFGYFIQFIFLISIILATSNVVKIVNWLNEFSLDYHEQIAPFEIADGELDISENMNKDYLQVKLYTDDTKNISEDSIKDLGFDNYHFSVLAFKDAIAVGSYRYGYISINYAESNIQLNKQELWNMINTSKNDIPLRVILFCTLWIGLFVGFFITRLIYVLLMSAILMLLGSLFRIKYPYKEFFKIAFYVITLPTIVEVIALITVGELNDYTTITYYLLCYVYMFYAVRALKLDNILVETQEKIMSIKNESEKANSVLENEKNKKEEHDNESDSQQQSQQESNKKNNTIDDEQDKNNSEDSEKKDKE